MSRHALIVNADDLGLSEAVNEGILQVVRAGTATAVALLVNPPHEADLRPFLEAGVSLGLHLNLTRGRPCLPAAKIPALVDETGQFLSAREQMLARLEEPQARAELTAQLERFQEMAGQPPEQVSFHKHLHVLDERVWAMVMQLAREAGAWLRTVDAPTRRRCRAGGVATTDHFLGGVQPAPYWTLERLQEELGRVGEGVTELMCHPGKCRGPVEGLSYVAEREVECRTFTSAEARRRLADCELTTFRRLGSAGRTTI